MMPQDFSQSQKSLGDHNPVSTEPNHAAVKKHGGNGSMAWNDDLDMLTAHVEE